MQNQEDEMRKTLNIGGIKCEFKTSAAIPRMYRIKFGRDIFVDMQRLKKQVDEQEKIKEEQRKKAEEKEFDESQFESQLPIDSLEMFENIAFLMHKHGDPEQPKDINEWLEQFETFDIYEILPEILEMWNLENKQKSTPKKGKGKQIERLIPHCFYLGVHNAVFLFLIQTS